MGLTLETKRLNDPRSSVQLVAGMETPPPPPPQNHLSKVEEGEGQGLMEPRESLHYTHTHSLSLYVYTLNPSIIYLFIYLSV